MREEFLSKPSEFEVAAKLDAAAELDATAEPDATVASEVIAKPDEAIDPEASVSFEAAAGRDIAALLNPAPLTIIGARDCESGRIGFATVLWAMPLSHDPAMLAFALRPKSHTMGIILETGCFSLCTLPADDEAARIAELCGKSSGHKVDKGALIEHRLLACPNAESCPSDPSAPKRMLPVVAHALSWELCEVESIREAGDHLLVVGYVRQAETRASRDEKGRLAPAETLLCIQHDAYAAAGATLQDQDRTANEASA